MSLGNRPARCLARWRSDGLHSEQTVARVGETAARFTALTDDEVMLCRAAAQVGGKSVARLRAVVWAAPAGLAALLTMSVSELLAMDNLRAGERARGAAAPLIDVACAVLQWPELATFAAVLPQPNSAAGKGGRRMDYPPLLILICAVLERNYRSGTQVDAEMRNPYNWLRLRVAYRDLTGVWLREEPMTWAQFEHYRKQYLTPSHTRGEPVGTGVYDPANPTVLQQLIRHLRVVSVELARAWAGSRTRRSTCRPPIPSTPCTATGRRSSRTPGCGSSPTPPWSASRDRSVRVAGDCRSASRAASRKTFDAGPLQLRSPGTGPAPIAAQGAR
jgi:hypothetical protein